MGGGRSLLFRILRYRLYCAIVTCSVLALFGVRVRCVADESDAGAAIKHFDLPSVSETGYPTTICAEHGHAAFRVGFANGEVRRFVVEPKSDNEIIKLEGRVCALSIDPQDKRWAAIHLADNDQKVGILLGDAREESLEMVRDFKLVPGRCDCSLEFSESGKLVSFVIRMNGGRVTRVGIINCDSKRTVFNYGPYDSSYRQSFADSCTRILHFVDDDRVLGIAGMNRGSTEILCIESFGDNDPRIPAIERHLMQDARFDGGFQLRRKTWVAGTVWRLMPTEQADVIYASVDLHRKYDRGLAIQMIDISRNRGSVLGTSMTNFPGYGPTIEQGRPLAEPSYFLSSQSGPQIADTNWLCATDRRGVRVLTKFQGPDYFGTSPPLFVDAKTSTLVAMNKGSGDVWMCDVPSLENPRWFDTAHAWGYDPKIVFSGREQRYAALIDLVLESERTDPLFHTEQRVASDRIVVLPIADLDVTESYP